MPNQLKEDPETWKNEERSIEGESQPNNSNLEEDDEEYDEEEDDDYDPTAAKQQGEEGEISEEGSESEEDNEPQHDYSAIESSISSVKTRSQRYLEKGTTKKSGGGFEGDRSCLVKPVATSLDIDTIFDELKNNKVNRGIDDWVRSLDSDTSKEGKDALSLTSPPQTNTKTSESLEPKKIRIEVSYTFAGKVITESKLVDAGSAEAKAYLNSTNAITTATPNNSNNKTRSSVPVIREIPGSKEPVQLRIKLKRPSLIDKFLSTYNNKKQKLSTLEKSRLDWASFVDKRMIKDELTIGNRAGYLDKQEFLGRLQEKRDVQYQEAKQQEIQRQWQLQQQR